MDKQNLHNKDMETCNLQDYKSDINNDINHYMFRIDNDRLHKDTAKDRNKDLQLRNSH